MRREAMRIQWKISDCAWLSVVLTVLVLGLTSPAEAEDTWQELMLFNPPASQLELEKRGRVVIYDGLRDTQIDQAMDTQFERIQSMMFVRTVITETGGGTEHHDHTGTVVIEHDGC